MSYSESIQKIRQARADRDAVKEKIYNLQLKYLSLKKQQKKADRKEIADDKATTELIDSLQKEMAGLQEQLNNLTSQLNRLLLLNDRVKELQSQLQQLSAETEQIENKIAVLVLGSNNYIEESILENCPCEFASSGTRKETA